jgi:phosphomannomutase
MLFFLAQKKLRVNFADGWGLIRASNTTPCLILRFEAVNQAILDHIQVIFRDWISSIRPDLALPF